MPYSRRFLRALGGTTSTIYIHRPSDFRLLGRTPFASPVRVRKKDPKKSPRTQKPDARTPKKHSGKERERLGGAGRTRGTRSMTAREAFIHKMLDHAYHHPRPDRAFVPLQEIVDEVKARWSVKQRTVERDIEEMKNQGLPIETKRGVNGGVRYTQAVTDFPNLRLSQGELTLLVIGLKAVMEHRGTAEEQSVRDALAKLSEALDPLMTVNLKKLESVLTFRPGRFEAKVDPKVFDEVLRAALEEEEITFLHTKPDPDAKPVKRRVQPRHVGSIGSNWYLFVDDLDRDLEWRKFALTRVEKVALTGKRFVAKDEFDFDARMQGGIGAHGGGKPQKIRLRFSRNVRSYVLERKWHETEKVTPLPDGGLEMTLTARVNEELMRWIREWGAEAVVVEPAGLRRAVIENARRVLAAYGG